MSDSREKKDAAYLAGYEQRWRDGEKKLNANIAQLTRLKDTFRTKAPNGTDPADAQAYEQYCADLFRMTREWDRNIREAQTRLRECLVEVKRAKESFGG